MLFAALRPRDAVEAMLAVSVISAHRLMQDVNARTREPGLAPEQASKLTTATLAAKRSFEAALRMLQKRQQPAKAAQARPKPTVEKQAPEPAGKLPEVPPRPQFQPRDRWQADQAAPLRPDDDGAAARDLQRV